MTKALIIRYKKGEILKYYKSHDFQQEKKVHQLYPPPSHSVGEAALNMDQIISYDQEIVVQEFMQKKIMNKIGIGNIALTRWFLKDYLKSSNCSAFLISYQYDNFQCYYNQ